jgi:VanZ family protein
MEVTELGRVASEATSIRRVLHVCLFVTVATLMLAVLWGVHPPANTRFWDAVFDTGHIFVFGIIAILGLKIAETLYPHASRRIGYYVFGFTLSLGIGVAVEIWQLYDPVRTFEVVDLVNDLIGCAAFLMLHRAAELGFRPPRARFQGVGLVVSAFALIILGLLPLARTWRDYGRRDAAFPVLMEFTGDWYWRFVWTKQARPIPWPERYGALSRLARIRDAGNRGFFHVGWSGAVRPAGARQPA